MASARLNCPICCNAYTDPVSLPCGHNFCQDCITDRLNTQDESKFYVCPLCGKRFSGRPSLQRDPELLRRVERLQSEREKPEVFCRYCINPCVPAIKTCLRCEVSLCDKHLTAHNKELKHNLIDATDSLENRKCSVHKELLKYYCTEDAACVCATCCVLGEHKGHELDSLDDAAEKKKEKMRNDLQKLVSEREETERRVHSLQKCLTGEKEKAAIVQKQIIATFRDIKEQLETMEKQALDVLAAKLKQLSIYVSDLIPKLEKKKSELFMMINSIEEVLYMTDPLPVLQNTDFKRDEVCKQEDEEFPLVMYVDVDLILGNVSRSLSTIMSYATNTDVKYKFTQYEYKEEIEDESPCGQTEEEMDSTFSKSPDSADVTVSPVIDGRTYRLEMKCAGLFRCSRTGIKFQVKCPLTIEYELDSWGKHLVQPYRDVYAIVSPLFNIKTQVEPHAVSAVYLPHYLSAKDCAVYNTWIKCIHFKDEKMTLEPPTRMEDSYMVLENPTFSSFGIIVEIFDTIKRILFSTPGAVLIYCRKNTKYLIHLYLVPMNDDSVKEVIKKKEKRNGFRLIDRPAYIESVHTKKKYTVNGPKGSMIKPKVLYLLTKPSEQYPYAEIRLCHRDTGINLYITEKGRRAKIWDCLLEIEDLQILAEAQPPSVPSADSDGKAFLKDNYKSLCSRLGLLDPVLVALRHKRVINEHEEEEIRKNTTSIKCNISLLQMIQSKGAEDEFCNILKENDPMLFKDLEGKD
ncbi:uncharacterized protein LOC142098438 [Mixophyes fleayi]|uniref:uncharacterized protein LOC142098438 n=1 Tax=Mixophyes fleayi TaxID=3061075 RepID=UPI003F4DEDD0